jgi:hypothetical protein
VAQDGVAGGEVVERGGGGEGVEGVVALPAGAAAVGDVTAGPYDHGTAGVADVGAGLAAPDAPPVVALPPAVVDLAPGVGALVLGTDPGAQRRPRQVGDHRGGTAGHLVDAKLGQVGDRGLVEAGELGQR